MEKSPRTGKNLNLATYVQYGILEHCRPSHHIVSEDDFKILSLRGSKVELGIKESLVIQKMQHTPNKNLSTQLFLFISNMYFYNT